MSGSSKDKSTNQDKSKKKWYHKATHTELGNITKADTTEAADADVVLEQIVGGGAGQE